jgi:hypothetical protein
MSDRKVDLPSSMNINNNENVYLRIAYLSGFNMGNVVITYGHFIDKGEGRGSQLWALYIGKWMGAMIYSKSLFWQAMCLWKALQANHIYGQQESHPLSVYHHNY